MAATLPVARGQATCRHTPHCTLPLPPPGVSHQAHAPRTISHSETPPSELHQIRRRSPPTYSHTGRCNDHHHGFCVDQKCQQQAQEFTIEVILCKYSRRGNACSQSGDRSRIARLWPCGGGGGGREGWRLCRRGGKWVDGWWDVWVVVEEGEEVVVVVVAGGVGVRLPREGLGQWQAMLPRRVCHSWRCAMPA